MLFAVPRFGAVDRPTIVSAVLIVLYLMTPLDILLTWVPILGRARASLLKVEALLPELGSQAEAQGAVSEWVARTPVPQDVVSVETVGLEGATFTYHDASEERGFALGPLDLTLRRGEVVVLAGGNGSGKTTLVKLLAGLYRPESGVVKIDGRPVVDAEGELEAHRRLFSIVFADGHLFHDLRGLRPPPIDELARERPRAPGARFTGLGGRAGCRRSTCRRDSGGGWRSSPPGSRTGPFCILDEWAANQDPPSRGCSIPSGCPRCGPRARACW